MKSPAYQPRSQTSQWNPPQRARPTRDTMLARTDRYGVDRALVIPFPMVRSYREAHDAIGAAVRAHGDRFCGAVCLDPYVGETEFRHEVHRCREEYGFCALKFQPQVQPMEPSLPSSEFLFETAIENRMVLVCHTGSGIPYALPFVFMPRCGSIRKRNCWNSAYGACWKKRPAAEFALLGSRKSQVLKSEAALPL